MKYFFAYLDFIDHGQERGRNGTAVTLFYESIRDFTKIACQIKRKSR
jgi:hypothetical protein